MNNPDNPEPAAHPVKTRPWRTWLMLCLTSLVAFTVGLWSGRDRVETPAAIAGANAKPTAETTADLQRVKLSAEAIHRGNIEIVECQATPLEETLPLTGRLAVNEDSAARVGSFVGGRISRILATVGEYVKKGEPLVYVHTHELRDARAAEEKALARVTEKEKALAYAKAESERAERLLAAKAISSRERAQADANVIAANGELEQARAELTRATDFLEHLATPEDSREDVVIVSPISGVVLKRNMTLGGVVNEGDELMNIANLDTLWAIADAPQHLAAAVRTGQPVEVGISGFGERKFTGRVVHLGESLDPQLRTVLVRALIDNPRGVLRPEMYASILLRGGQTRSGVLIARDAVQEINGEPVVFAALADGVFEKRAVQTGREINGKIEIVRGLAGGERIVARGGFLIKSELLKGTISSD